MILLYYLYLYYFLVNTPQTSSAAPRKHTFKPQKVVARPAPYNTFAFLTKNVLQHAQKNGPKIENIEATVERGKTQASALLRAHTTRSA